MNEAAKHSLLSISLSIAGVLVLLAVIAGALERWLIRRGVHQPLVVRMINRASDRVVDAMKQPVTIAVLDEVAAVLQTGHYTRNIAAAINENRAELMNMVAEKIRDDPTTSRLSLVPFHDRIIELASETTLRVMLAILADPRTDELVADMLRDNITQIRRAVRDEFG